MRINQYNGYDRKLYHLTIDKVKYGIIIYWEMVLGDRRKYRIRNAWKMNQNKFHDRFPYKITRSIKAKVKYLSSKTIDFTPMFQ